MTVYLVILEDRHIDVQVEVYAKKQDAQNRFGDIVAEYHYHDDEESFLLPDGWLANARLSSEGDYVCVKEAEVH